MLKQRDEAEQHARVRETQTQVRRDQKHDITPRSTPPSEAVSERVSEKHHRRAEANIVRQLEPAVHRHSRSDTTDGRRDRGYDESEAGSRSRLAPDRLEKERDHEQVLGHLVSTSHRNLQSGNLPHMKPCLRRCSSAAP